MKKILYKVINQNNDCHELYYNIKGKQFILTLKMYNTKDIFKLKFSRTIKTISLDKENTMKLFNVIPEEKLKEYFGDESGFLKFQNYCLSNNIDHKYSSEMKK